MESQDFTVGDVDELVSALEAQLSDGPSMLDDTEPVTGAATCTGTCATTCTGGC